MRILHMTTKNAKNIAYLSSIYMPRIRSDLISRCYQILRHEYEYPYDMIHPDPNMGLRDVFKSRLIREFDLYFFHGDISCGKDVYKILDMIGNKTIIPWFYDDEDIDICLDNNAPLIEKASLILVRQPQLVDRLTEWRDKTFYIPSPCSIKIENNTLLGTIRTEFVFPDTWKIISHFGKNNRFLGIVQSVARIHDDETIAYHEIHDATRSIVLSCLERIDINISSASTDFYSQSAIETGMAGIPTIISIHPALMDYVKDSPFILIDRSNPVKQLSDIIDDLEKYKANTLSHEFFEQHFPENSMKLLLDIMHKKGVI